MEAKNDAVVTDSAGLERKLFAGQRVPVELEEAYTKASKSSSKAEKAPEVDKAERAPELDKAEKAPEVTKSTRSKRRS